MSQPLIVKGEQSGIVDAHRDDRKRFVVRAVGSTFGICFVIAGVYVRSNMNRILLLKRWRPRIRLPRRKRRNIVRQLEFDLWPKRQTKR